MKTPSETPQPDKLGDRQAGTAAQVSDVTNASVAARQQLAPQRPPPQPLSASTLKQTATVGKLNQRLAFVLTIFGARDLYKFVCMYV